MPLDPVDAHRLGTVEQGVANLTESDSRLAQRTIALNARLRVVEARNKALWGLCIALFLLFLGGISSAVYWAGHVDAGLKAQDRRIDEANAAIKGLERDLREYERRSGQTKPATK